MVFPNVLQTQQPQPTYTNPMEWAQGQVVAPSGYPLDPQTGEPYNAPRDPQGGGFLGRAANTEIQGSPGFDYSPGISLEQVLYGNADQRNMDARLREIGAAAGLPANFDWKPYQAQVAQQAEMTKQYSNQFQNWMIPVLQVAQAASAQYPQLAQVIPQFGQGSQAWAAGEHSAAVTRRKSRHAGQLEQGIMAAVGGFFGGSAAGFGGSGSVGAGLGESVSGAYAPAAGELAGAAGSYGATAGGLGTAGDALGTGLTSGAGGAAGITPAAGAGATMGTGASAGTGAMGAGALGSGIAGAAPAGTSLAPGFFGAETALPGLAATTTALGGPGGSTVQGAYKFPWQKVAENLFGAYTAGQAQDRASDLLDKLINSDQWRQQAPRYYEPLYDAATKGIGDTAYGQSIAEQTARQSAAKGYNMSGNMLADIAKSLNTGTTDYVRALSPLAMGRGETQAGSVAGPAMLQAGNQQNAALGGILNQVFTGAQPTTVQTNRSTPTNQNFLQSLGL